MWVSPQIGSTGSNSSCPRGPPAPQARQADDADHSRCGAVVGMLDHPDQQRDVVAIDRAVRDRRHVELDQHQHRLHDSQTIRRGLPGSRRTVVGPHRECDVADSGPRIRERGRHVRTPRMIQRLLVPQYPGRGTASGRRADGQCPRCRRDPWLWSSSPRCRRSLPRPRPGSAQGRRRSLRPRTSRRRAVPGTSARQDPRPVHV